MDYEYTDKVIAYIDKQLIERYSRLKSLVSFDELNVLQEVNALYQEIDTLIRKTFLKLADKVYSDNIRAKDHRSLDEQWVDALLSAYDPVSKYVFTHEENRKCARLIEAVIASSTKAQEIDAALRSMSFMCRIYAVRVTDEAALQAFKDDEEDLVRWIAEKDEKTCTVCHKRDGKIYEIDLLPAKPHPNCRCSYERVK
jgi:SPP1 gp7 family putative phage head morphogenesis protein